MPETKQYGIIYADPPWHYDRKHGSGVAENHYPTMSIEEICALPVSELAAKDSALFLWATFPQLNEAFRVIDAWGFKYKTLAFLCYTENRSVKKAKQLQNAPTRQTFSKAKCSVLIVAEAFTGNAPSAGKNPTLTGSTALQTAG